MRRFLTLVCLFCLAVPAGISISGCTRNPAANYCNGAGYGMKIGDVAQITLGYATTGISIAYGQTRQSSPPVATNCKGTTTSTPMYVYGTTNNQLVDISPAGNICAGTWNRNTGGGIANYTICTPPNPLPSTGGLPYATAYITASADSVVSNPVKVFVHAPVTSVNLVTQPLSGPSQQCYSQGSQATFDAEACFVSNNTQYELCAPPSVTGALKPVYACKGGLPPGVTSSAVPDCTAAVGSLTYQVGIGNVGSIATNTTTNQETITAGQPGTTAITASVAGSGSSAGYFSTCPPASIKLTLANGETAGTVTLGVTENLVTSVIDSLGNPISGLSLDYQSTDPMDITANGGGAIATAFPGVASVYAICQPPSCNPAPINEVGVYGTGLSVSSNPVTITTPGTASDYIWVSAPGQSQYVVPVDRQTGTVGSTTRLPYVPNSMLMDRTGYSLYFGSSNGLMILNTATVALGKQDPTVPGVVLAVSPNNAQVLINDQQRKLLYLYTVITGASTAIGGMGNAAVWSPDAKTLYVTDNAALNSTPGSPDDLPASAKPAAESAAAGCAAAEFTPCRVSTESHAAQRGHYEHRADSRPYYPIPGRISERHTHRGPHLVPQRHGRRLRQHDLLSAGAGRKRQFGDRADRCAGFDHRWSAYFGCVSNRRPGDTLRHRRHHPRVQLPVAGIQQQLSAGPGRFPFAVIADQHAEHGATHKGERNRCQSGGSIAGVQSSLYHLYSE